MRPRPPQVVLGLGTEAFEQERYDRAVGPLREFFERYGRHPAHAGVCRMLANALVRLGRGEEAAAVARAGIEQHGADASAVLALGHAERLSGRYQNARETYEGYVRDGLGPVGVAYGALAEVSLRLRDVEGARAWIGRADAEGAAEPAVERSRAMVALRTGEGREDALERLRSVSAGAGDGMDSTGRAAVHSAMGDLLDAMDRPGEAFEQYTICNEVVGGGAFDPDATVRMYDAVARAWTPETIARLRRFGDASARPVLVVGTPRSGTTMTEMLLAEHPDVAAGGELGALSEAVGPLHGSVPGELEERVASLGESDIARAAGVYLDALSSVDAAALRVTDKMPMNLVLLGAFAAMFPNGRVVHCRRDPRDACLSAYCRHFMQDHPWSRRLDWLAAFYRAYNGLMAHWRRVFEALGDGVMLEVRYERVVEDPRGYAGQLAAHVGLDAGGDDALGGGEGAGVNAPTLRADQVGRGVYRSSAGRHERYADQLAPLCEDLADIIEAYGSGS